MGNRTLKMALLVLIPLLILFFGTTFALMLRQTDVLDNQFEVAIVACEVEETFNGTTKSSIAVKNTGNIESYLRVRLVSYWVDSEGKIVSKPSQTPQVSPANDWLKGSDNTYYYPKPINPGITTPNLGSITLEQDNNGYRQVVEVFADAIQSKPTDAVIDSWGVSLSGNRITVP